MCFADGNPDHHPHHLTAPPPLAATSATCCLFTTSERARVRSSVRARLRAQRLARRWRSHRRVRHPENARTCSAGIAGRPAASARARALSDKRALRTCGRHIDIQSATASSRLTSDTQHRGDVVRLILGNSCRVFRAWPRVWVLV